MSKSFVLRAIAILGPLFSLVHAPLRSASDTPSASLPFMRSPVALDGRISAGEWDDAALLYPATVLGKTDDSEHSGSPSPVNARTAARLKYDNTHLYVAITCDEDQPGYPEAYQRGYDGDFTQDDSVQVVLGLEEPATVEREVLDMGGYDGAMGTPAVAADHYYQFNVNAAGARQRMWNERPLTAPRFESAVARTGSGWTVEYKIPFASFGATSEVLRSIADGSTPLFLNILRYRPPQLIGWHLPGYGGYRGMPFGQARLLPSPSATSGIASGRDLQPTREQPPARLAVKAGKPPREARVAIGYYPLQGSVIGIIDGPLPSAAARATHVVLRVTGLPDTTRALKPAASLTARDRQFVITRLQPGTQPARTARLDFYTTDPARSSGAKPVHSITRDLPAVTAPEWHDTDAGADYIHDKIPPPWTRPDVDPSAASIRLVDKTLRFGAFGLPESVILSDGTELLAGPAQIILSVGERELRFSPRPPVITPDGNNARVAATAVATTPEGAVSIETKSRVDFDGFVETKLRIRLPAGGDGQAFAPGKISRLSIRIPVRRDIARYVHRVLVQEIAALDGYGFQGPAGPVWTGNQQGGLAFSYDTPLFFSRDIRRQVRLVEEADRVFMEFNLVDAPGQFPASLPGIDSMGTEVAGEPILRFFLQPTPTRPRPEHTFNPWVTDYKWEMWSDWQGYPDLKKIPELKKWASAVVAVGRIPTLYTCQGLAEDSPDFEAFKEDMMLQPPWRFYRRHHNPGKDVNAWATSKRGPEGDLQLWAFRKLANEAAISGILSDGLGIAWADDNPGNAAGGGQPANITWEEDSPTRVTAQRTFLKRLRGIFADTGRPLAMSAHTGGGLDPHTLSFFDYYIDGEQLARFPASYQPPLASYAIGYSGQPWGFRGTFWVKRWIRSEGPFRALTYALLHDNEIRDNSLFQEVLKEIAPSGPDAPAPSFHPYWKPNPHLQMRSRTGDSRVSLYLTEDQALVIVGNTGLAGDSVALDLSRLFASSGSEPLADTEDILTGTPWSLADGRCTVDLAPGRCVVLRVSSTRQAAALAASAWDASGTLAGWMLPAGAVPGLLPDGRRAAVLSGKDAGDEVRAVFSARPLSSAASAEFLLLPTDNFRLYLGDGALVWTRARGWSVEGFRAHGVSGAGSSAATSDTTSPHAPPALGRLFDPPLRTTDAEGRPRFASLKINIRGCILDATLDDQPLARGLQWGSLVTAGRPLTLAFSIRDGGELTFAPVALRSGNIRLYEGGLVSSRVAVAPAAAPFDLTDIPPGDWSVNTGAQGISSKPATLGGRPALTIDPGRSRVVATLKHTVGDTFSAVLRFEQLPRRFVLRIGSISLKYDGRWVLDGPLNGWGRGVGPRTADKAASPQPVIAPDVPVALVMSMRDGVLDMVVNNELLVREVAFDIPRDGNVVSLETWAKFPATFRLEKLSSTPATLYAPQTAVHPVQ
ncbi:hypothetical protein OPIT5_14345 [Opitutaceae bacterium TAV5]|nr:hypothetical protein OPIT5_14345 [Opitutaceae bacterium TAV5]